MENIFEIIENAALVPVIKLDRSDDAISLCRALYEGGIGIAEITFRTDAAEESIKKVSSELKDVLVGAGTVTTKEQLDRAVSAGAKFIVSPGFNPKIVEHALSKNIPIIPGCTTPSEIEAALEFGINVLKFFPAEQSGGLAKIKALCAPYTNIRFIPTGGIDLQNISSYLEFEKILACGGSFMIKDEYVKEGSFDRITEMTKTAVNAILGFEISYGAIGVKDDKSFSDEQKYLSDIFSLPPVKCGLHTQIGNLFMLDKKEDSGCIAIKTVSLERAIYHMKKRGAMFDEKSRILNAKNKTISIDLIHKTESFKIRLIKK